MKRPEGIETPDSAMVVVAHPDDAEFQCGATLAKWARLGCTVHHLVLTDGSKGTWDRNADTAALARLRQTEQRAAARALGATGEVLFLGRTDGELVADHATRGAVAAEMRRLRPSVVLAHDPWKRYRLHPDHHAAGRSALDAVVAARDPFFHREQLDGGLEVHRPVAVLLFEADEVDHYEEVTEEDLEAKLTALEEHRSQLDTTHLYGLDRDGAEDPMETFRRRQRARLEQAARQGGCPGRLAEGFHILRDQL